MELNIKGWGGFRKARRTLHTEKIPGVKEGLNQLCKYVISYFINFILFCNLYFKHIAFRIIMAENKDK